MIILSAALDLVPATTPKGLVAFFNIFPALIVSTVPQRLMNISLADYLLDQGSLAPHITRKDSICSASRLLHMCELAGHSGEPAGRRDSVCVVCAEMLKIIAFSASLYPRLFGISMASLSSGLGELTFLQMTTTLPTRNSSRTALGAWSSGTGFAGIAGAAIWWLLRGLGVKGGLGISSVSCLFLCASGESS